MNAAGAGGQAGTAATNPIMRATTQAIVVVETTATSHAPHAHTGSINNMLCY